MRDLRIGWMGKYKIVIVQHGNETRVYADDTARHAWISNVWCISYNSSYLKIAFKQKDKTHNKYLHVYQPYCLHVKIETAMHLTPHLSISSSDSTFFGFASFRRRRQQQEQQQQRRGIPHFDKDVSG